MTDELFEKYKVFLFLCDPCVLHNDRLRSPCDLNNLQMQNRIHKTVDGLTLKGVVHKNRFIRLEFNKHDFILVYKKLFYCILYYRQSL